MTYPTDWADQGVFPLQDHGEDEPELDMRQMLVGGRVIEITELAEVLWDEGPDGTGTVGDIHPWRFWPASGRYIGSWAQAYPSIASSSSGGQQADAQPGGGRSWRWVGGSSEPVPNPVANDPWSGAVPAGAFGIGDGVPGRSHRPPEEEQGGGEISALPLGMAFSADARYSPVPHTMPQCWPVFPHGWIGIALAGTDETAQQDIWMPVDPRLVCVGAHGPAGMSSEVIDLEPARTPNQERRTKLHSAWEIVRLPEMDGVAKSAALAVQYKGSRQGNIAGYGLAIGKADQGDPGGGGTTTPDDQGRGGETPTGQDPVVEELDEVVDDGGSGVVESQPDPWTGEAPPGQFGFFGPGDSAPRGLRSGGARANPCGSPRATSMKDEAHVAFFMASPTMFGPIHPGHMEDKHQFDKTEDGQGINSGHIASTAYYYDDKDRDGPFHYEGKYPDPDPLPNIGRVHLTWDGAEKHAWAQDEKDGKWKWFCEIADFGSGPPTYPVPTEPGAQEPNQPNAPPASSPPPPSGPPAGPSPSAPPVAPPPAPPTTTPAPTPGVPGVPGAQTPAPTIGGGAGGASRPWGVTASVMAASKVAQAPRNTGPSYQTVMRNVASGFASVHFRPQRLVDGETDFRYSMHVDQGEQAADDAVRPVVARMEAFAVGQQDQAGYSYAVEPDVSRWWGGEGVGGVAFLHPYTDLADLVEDLEPGGMNTDKAYMVFAPYTGIGLGVPDTSSGGVEDTGWIIDRDDTDSDRPLRIMQMESGAPVELLTAVKDAGGDVRVTAAGTHAFRVPVGTTAQRPSAALAGDVRLNSTTGEFEGYDGSGWLTLG